MNLYEKIKLDECEKLMINDETFMTYCPQCNMETTYKRSDYYKNKRMSIELDTSCYVPPSDGRYVKPKDEKQIIISTMFNLNDNDSNSKNCLYIQEYECCINKNHKKYNIYCKEDDNIVKIGQYPSEVDNGDFYLRELKSICSNNESKEIIKYIKTAFIMESYGYGIASLLYIRRAFEKLIALSEDKLRLGNTGISMKERIKSNTFLPKEIKENCKIYNIISEGIHNETEKECKELFKIIKCGVTILIQRTYAHIQSEKELLRLKELSK